MKNPMPDAEQPIILPAEDMEIAPAKPESPLVGALKKPGAYLSGALRSLKGRDMDTLIEEFTAEMTLVLEGLSDDQERLGARSEALAQQCALLHEENQRLGRRLEEQARQQEALTRQAAALEKRVQEMERKAAERHPREGLIRRLTWLAGLCIAATMLLTVVKVLFD